MLCRLERITDEEIIEITNRKSMIIQAIECKQLVWCGRMMTTREEYLKGINYIPNKARKRGRTRTKYFLRIERSVTTARDYTQNKVLWKLRCEMRQEPYDPR